MGGVRKRPIYKIVIADGRYPRDGKFIEKIGSYNPLLPKDKKERIKIEAERVKYWMSKGAQPTLRVSRILGEKEILPMPPKGNNPLKAIPKKDRKKDKSEGEKSPAQAADATNGVVTTFPGGVAASASKAGSKYPFLFASTYEAYCPTLRTKLGGQSQVPEGVTSIMEIIINGHDLDTVTRATHNALDATNHLQGLELITAGNYGGRLGKSFIHLRPDLQLSSDVA